MTKSSKKTAKRKYSQDFSGNGKTQQHFKDSCDVNNIIAHHTATGLDPYAERKAQEKFGFASSKTFSEAMQQTAEINSAFESLPSSIRASHSNDPAAWLDTLAALPPEEGEKTPPEPSQEPQPDASPSPSPTINEGELDST